MLFVVLANDRDGMLERRVALRQKHIEYWDGLGVVRVGGAMMTSDDASGSPKGSALVIEAENLAEVRKLVAEDPFTKEGVFGDEVRIETLRPGIGLWLS